MWIWQIFIQLSRRREYGFNGPQPIRYSEMVIAANEYGVETYIDRTRFIDRLSVLDDVYLEHIANRAKSKEQASSQVDRKVKR